MLLNGDQDDGVGEGDGEHGHQSGTVDFEETPRRGRTNVLQRTKALNPNNGYKGIIYALC